MPGSVAEPTANEWTTLEYVASTTYDYKFPEARLSVLSLNINGGGGIFFPFLFPERYVLNSGLKLVRIIKKIIW